MRGSDVENSILVDLLVHGTNNPQNISQHIQSPRSSVSRSCGDLLEDGLVFAKGNGVYSLTGEGRKVAQDLVEQGYNPYQE